MKTVAAWYAVVAEKLLEAIRRPISHDGMVINVRASHGVALCPFHGDDPQALFKVADGALYQTKAKGRDGWVLAVGENLTERPESWPFWRNDVANTQALRNW